MAGNGKTDLQRQILLTWYENPNATNTEISEMCDCSASYVSQIKNRFDDYNEMEYMMDRQDEELEAMSGGDVFPNSSPNPENTTVGNNSNAQQGPGLAEVWDDLPDNPIGNIMRLLILLVLLYVVYEVAMTLLL